MSGKNENKRPQQRTQHIEQHEFAFRHVHNSGNDGDKSTYYW